ncbi:MAG: A/G-specific adenine glycosylase [Candidatus Nomurabacteria bacterium]|nr:A/G-specific adenine glycosylase [Candidatus Nomurabacteria bacterium]
MTNAQQKRFIETVRQYYRTHGRHDLPWRLTIDPYKIIVSEVMLQQTQAGRVVGKYKEFLKAFPTARSLASAPLQQVLLHWSGLGYNRRARFLQQMAQTVMQEYNGVFPKTFNELITLPGIGAYTAGAVMAFAYNSPVAVIETNIRTVYLHHFFPDAKETVHDNELLALIATTLDQKNPRAWYWALMDYGSYLKSIGVRIHRNSAQYKKQSTFAGSLRQVRGSIVKVLTTQSATIGQLQKITGFEKERILEAARTLLKEGLIIKKGSQLGIS